MPSEAITVLEVGDRLIQFGSTRKTAVEGRVDFARRFDGPPRVVITPFWEGSRSEVGHAETLGRVDETYRIHIRSGGVRDFGFGAGAETGTDRTAPFSAPPTVLVTPYWDGQGRGVGHAETLNAVEAHWMSLAGGNGAANYSVSVFRDRPPG